MKKTERVDIRVSPETKKLLAQQAQKYDMNHSNYLCHLIEKDAKKESHEQQIEESLAGNHIFNSLLLNSDLSNKSKQIIGKEVGKYV